MVANDRYVHKLQKHSISPSHQRVMILKYLVENQCHPSVDQIFNALRSSIPTLSKATVYNTLNLFIEAKLVRVLAIEEKETRFDIVMQNHGHFKCTSCGNIYNFAVDIDRFLTDDLRGFQVAEKNVHFHGICPACITSEQKK